MSINRFARRSLLVHPCLLAASVLLWGAVACSKSATTGSDTDRDPEAESSLTDSTYVSVTSVSADDSDLLDQPAVLFAAASENVRRSLRASMDGALGINVYLVPDIGGMRVVVTSNQQLQKSTILMINELAVTSLLREMDRAVREERQAEERQANGVR